MVAFFRRANTTSPAGDNIEADAGNPDHSDSTTAADEVNNLGEYAALERYISIYRDGANCNEEALPDDDETGGRRWWRFWKRRRDQKKSANSDRTTATESWLETDIRCGLRFSDVDERRMQSGWNELSAEKENPVAKFFGFFTGPILYGTCALLIFHVQCITDVR